MIRTAAMVLEHTRQEWAGRITSAWCSSLDGIFEAGHLLIAAKADPKLPHGDFEQMVEDDLPFGPRAARMLMQIARDPRLANRKHVSVLPPHWGTLYQLTLLPDEVFEEKIADGTINPEMQRKDVTRARRSAARRNKNVRVLDLAPAHDERRIAPSLESIVASGEHFSCIYTDPPWLYDNQGTRASTDNHYGGMTVDELCALPIREIAAENAHLHMWTTNGFLFECPRIFEAWGFEFRSSFIWVKSQIGIGNYWRNSHEFLLTAIRGDAKRFNDKSLRSWLECDRGEHSSKPEQVRKFVEAASSGPYLEMFARRTAPGWTVWGDEVSLTLFDSREVA